MCVFTTWKGRVCVVTLVTCNCLKTNCIIAGKRKINRYEYDSTCPKPLTIEEPHVGDSTVVSSFIGWHLKRREYSTRVFVTYVWCTVLDMNIVVIIENLKGAYRYNVWPWAPLSWGNSNQTATKWNITILWLLLLAISCPLSVQGIINNFSDHSNIPLGIYKYIHINGR